MSTQLRELRLVGNSRMEGCVPLTPFTTLAVADTRISGLCSDTSGEAERAQLDALTQLLSKVFNAEDDPLSTTDDFVAIWRLVAAISNPFVLTRIKQSDSPSMKYTDDYGRGSVELVFEVIQGALAVTELVVTGGGLDMLLLPQLVAGLPALHTLACYNCTYNAGVAPASRLPPKLAAAAPASFRRLVLDGCALQGGLPDAWGSWTTIESIELAGNALASSLPASWQGMAGLQYLDVTANALIGTLPVAWGAGSMRADLRMRLSGNKLTGLIPSTWARFTGGIFVSRTNISQDCVPDQLM